MLLSLVSFWLSSPAVSYPLVIASPLFSVWSLLIIVSRMVTRLWTWQIMELSLWFQSRFLLLVHHSIRMFPHRKLSTLQCSLAFARCRPSALKFITTLLGYRPTPTLRQTPPKCSLGARKECTWLPSSIASTRLGRILRHKLGLLVYSCAPRFRIAVLVRSLK